MPRCGESSTFKAAINDRKDVPSYVPVMKARSFSLAPAWREWLAVRLSVLFEIGSRRA
jgi:hypothetical protein